MEFLPGGDLYSLLQNIGYLDENTTKNYTTQILSALRYLHSNGIIHRDLKPDNILISKNGYLKLTDFGLSHIGVVDRTNITSEKISSSSSLVGTPDYMAPEILLNLPHSYSVDYWSLGVIVYEFLFSIPPFHAENENDTYTNILKGKIIFDDDIEISIYAKDFILKLLTIDPNKRLGSNNIDEIFNHPWIKGINPEEIEPPFIPKLKSESDTNYFSQRYNFSNDDDNDILIDVRNNHNPLLDNNIPEINSFTSISVNRLIKSNEEAVQKINNKRSSFDDLNNQIKDFNSPTKNSLLIEKSNNLKKNNSYVDRRKSQQYEELKKNQNFDTYEE